MFCKYIPSGRKGALGFGRRKPSEAFMFRKNTQFTKLDLASWLIRLHLESIGFEKSSTLSW